MAPGHSPQHTPPALPTPVGRLDARILRRAPRTIIPERQEDAQLRARAFHAFLEACLGPLHLTLTDNRRRVVSAQTLDDMHELRLHWMFVWADPTTAHALVDFVLGDARAEAPVRDYVAERRDWLCVTPDQDELPTDGEVHDLRALLDEVRDTMRVVTRCDVSDLDEVEDVVIRWGRRSRGKRTIRLGSFDFDLRMIRVHPSLDQEWVPAFFVEFIIYHELLHGLLPPTRGNATARRAPHHAEFRHHERLFPRYDEALAWEAAHINRLLQGT